MKNSENFSRTILRQVATINLKAMQIAGAFFVSLMLLVDAGNAKDISDSLAQRVKACTACHGLEGRATTGDYYPRIAGKPEGYLFNQLKNFRDGKRTYPLMNYLVANLSDTYLKEIARYFSEQHPPYAASQRANISDTNMERGQKLVVMGDPRIQLPACVACHGKKMTGVAPFVPGLLGLPRDYLVAQLGAWQVGTRKAAAPDCMHTVAAKLSAADIGAVSTWLAAQIVPADALPAQAADDVSPLRCGSIATLNVK